ncbi:DUF2478 domain-containing protein [Aliiroseovarius subalbicans]|uniref:DUF2478 domain-containing protein n=1 Tax=Aliiroseovarius subalbicans TaxID=2925840 RepID=UPI001F596B06|nr:DUF2478 domain-containing protein [Aliiroseovarius subalbicans]MCI2399614.1 DUF2478 domain-containing protein [Aliiroseovarius subalbicans]
MNIAYTMAPGRGDTNSLLFKLAQSLVARGYRPSGTVQIDTERDYDGPCDMDVKVLPDGSVLRISQNLGRGSSGCRLDVGALETAVGLVGADLASGADCLIVNKFGKHEAEGHGFRTVIADALARDIPVLVGTNKLNQAAFETFADGLAQNLPPDLKSLEDWVFTHSPLRAKTV